MSTEGVIKTELKLTGDVVNIDGTADSDIILVNGDPSHVRAGDGNDTVLGNTQSDIIEGGKGADLLFGDNPPKNGASFNKGVEELRALMNNPVATVSQLNAIIAEYFPVHTQFGQQIGGNDEIYGGPDGDKIYGGPGNNILSGGDRPAGDGARSPSSKSSTASSPIESGNDTIVSGEGKNTIILSGGNDLVIGLGENDTLEIPKSIINSISGNMKVANIEASTAKSRSADGLNQKTISWKDEKGDTHTTTILGNIDNIKLEGVEENQKLSSGVIDVSGSVAKSK